MSRSPLEAWLRPHELLVDAGGTWDLGDGRRATGFAAWCAAHRGHACRLNVSSAFVTELPVDPALPLDGDAELLDWARVQLRSHGGDASSAWSCAAWQAAAARGVSVLHGIDFGELRATAVAARVRLRVVRPWWAAALRRCARATRRLAAPRARLVVVERARIAAVELESLRVTQASTAYLDAPTAAALADWAAAQPPADTLAFGHGLEPGPLPGIEALPGLHDASPAAAWQGSAR